MLSVPMDVFCSVARGSARLRSVDGVQWERWMKQDVSQALHPVCFFVLEAGTRLTSSTASSQGPSLYN